MASYLRPRRGKRATAVSQGIVLKRGEVFFETPDSGVGTGIGKIKMGDGTTSYNTLPYFMEQGSPENSTIGFTNATSATSSQNNATYLSNIAPSNSLKTIFTNLKQLLFNYNTQLTSLNNDMVVVDNQRIRFGVTSSGEYGYIKVGADTVTPFKSGGIDFKNMIVSNTEISEGSLLSEGTMYVVYVD